MMNFALFFRLQFFSIQFWMFPFGHDPSSKSNVCFVPVCGVFAIHACMSIVHVWCRYTKGCDWWALGVLLYEMRTGRQVTSVNLTSLSMTSLSLSLSLCLSVSLSLCLSVSLTHSLTHTCLRLHLHWHNRAHVRARAGHRLKGPKWRFTRKCRRERRRRARPPTSHHSWSLWFTRSSSTMSLAGSG
jgi:serine/threonine protein kinase